MKLQRSVSMTYMLLSVVYIVCLLTSNLIAGKMMNIGEFVVPVAVILFPITYILSDVFTEVYGFSKMRFIIWLGFICNFFVVFIYAITIKLPYPSFWENQDAYSIVLGTTPRVLIASLVGYLFGEFSNAFIISKLKVKTKGKYLWIRTISSTIVGEALDTIIFITISFYGVIDYHQLLSMIICQYSFKVGYEFIFTPLTYLVVNKIKKLENIDIFDDRTNYSIINIRSKVN